MFTIKPLIEMEHYETMSVPSYPQMSALTLFICQSILWDIRLSCFSAC